jgi:hypothetical protein
MHILNLDILQHGLQGITSTRGKYYMEAAIVSLRKKGFVSGVILQVSGFINEDLVLIWTHELTDYQIMSWRDEVHSSNFGAVGIAILLTSELLGFQTFEESVIGTGIDFWIGKTPPVEGEISFAQIDARLEISGIGLETDGNTINMRVNQKKKQMIPSDSTFLPGWVVVVEFGTPKSTIVRK